MPCDYGDLKLAVVITMQESTTKYQPMGASGHSRTFLSFPDFPIIFGWLSLVFKGECFFLSLQVLTFQTFFRVPLYFGITRKNLISNMIPFLSVPPLCPSTYIPCCPPLPPSLRITHVMHASLCPLPSSPPSFEAAHQNSPGAQTTGPSL